MNFEYIKSKVTNKTIATFLVCLIIFFLFILPLLERNETFDATNLHKMDTNICSKQCCKFTQWPVGFNTVNPNIPAGTLDKFIPTNFACNNGENGGCVCATKDDYNYLSNKGQDHVDDNAVAHSSSNM